ncbi:MAG: dihydroneopterin aldolase, partial [Propionibacteriaceae bacterium]|nr:dihydroneopterin aldolase [Propionibacteriaceae bacterium]
MSQAHPYEIAITGIKVNACHGVYPKEKVVEQEFRIDVVLSLLRPSDADELCATVDYSQVAKDIAFFVSSTSFDLIETLASGIARELLE